MVRNFIGEGSGIFLFNHYQPIHRERLIRLVKSPPWRELLNQPEVLQQLKREKVFPPSPPSQLGGPARYLKDRNGAKVQTLLRSGVRDEEKLLQALADWNSALEGDPSFPILFLGLVLTLDCSFSPRCLYCNQGLLPRRLRLKEWKALIAESAEPIPPYVYITGGEPLILQEEVWGDEGLVAFATQKGCAVNINTNATLITPKVALQLVKVGLSKLHISLDSVDPEVQGELFQGRERIKAVLKGIFNIQIARELLEAYHPLIHINCVLTRKNLFQFPQLLKFLLEIRKIRSPDHPGKITSDPLFGDFALHLIPVGGQENAFLRPTAEEWKQFYTHTWAEAEQIWQEYQTSIGVPEEERRSLIEQYPFANPFSRVNHRMSLEEYCQQSAQGIYWQGALTDRCYVAPSQAFILPDGSQHWCGAHAIKRPPPLGNVLEVGLRENIRRNLNRLARLPSDICANCAGATCVINQAIRNNLIHQIREWLQQPASS